MNTTSSQLSSIVLQFQLDRDENPRLYDDLMRFKKGAKRVNRLRFLAHEGLRSQMEPQAPALPTTALHSQGLSAGPVDAFVMPNAGDLFGAPLK